MNPVKDDMGITMDYCAAKQHVPEAERNNRVIKERTRVGYHRLPYKNTPKVMIEVLVLDSTGKLNMFPAKGGISTYYSPHAIITKEVLNYKKHFEVPFGAYVQATYVPKTTNTMVERTKDGIYLQALHNNRGGHLCLSLTTKRTFTCAQVKSIPLTDTATQAVEQMALDDGVQQLE